MPPKSDDNVAAVKPFALAADHDLDAGGTAAVEQQAGHGGGVDNGQIGAAPHLGIEIADPAEARFSGQLLIGTPP